MCWKIFSKVLLLATGLSYFSIIFTKYEFTDKCIDFDFKFIQNSWCLALNIDKNKIGLGISNIHI